MSLSAGNARCGVLHSLCWGTNTGTGSGYTSPFAPQCLELGQAISPHPPAGNVHCGVLPLEVVRLVVSMVLVKQAWGLHRGGPLLLLVSLTDATKRSAQSTHRDNPVASMRGRDYKIGWYRGSPQPLLRLITNKARLVWSIACDGSTPPTRAGHLYNSISRAAVDMWCLTAWVNRPLFVSSSVEWPRPSHWEDMNWSISSM